MVFFGNKQGFSMTALFLQVITLQVFYIVKKIRQANVTEAVFYDFDHSLCVYILKNCRSKLLQLIHDKLYKNLIPKEAVDKQINGSKQAHQASNSSKFSVNVVESCMVVIELACSFYIDVYYKAWVTY